MVDYKFEFVCCLEGEEYTQQPLEESDITNKLKTHLILSKKLEITQQTHKAPSRQSLGTLCLGRPTHPHTRSPGIFNPPFFR